MNTYATVVLAAGNGTRMRSTLPKVLHPLAGMPLLAHVLKAVEAIPTAPSFAPLLSIRASHRPIVVLGYQAERVQATFGDRCLYALQAEQLGTGHAVLAAKETVDMLNPLPEMILVCYGDTPLISSEMLARVLIEHQTHQAVVTFLTAFTEQPSDFGRVVRDSNGRVCEIVDAKRVAEEQKSIKEIGSGIYCFDCAWLWPSLQMLVRKTTGESDLLDLISLAISQGRKIVTVSETFEATIEVNDRVQLAAAEQLLRRRILERHMYAVEGVRIPERYFPHGEGNGGEIPRRIVMVKEVFPEKCLAEQNVAEEYGNQDCEQGNALPILRLIRRSTREG